MTDLLNYKCPTCRATLQKKDKKGKIIYACPNYKTSCPGFLFNPSEAYWKIASETSIGTMYDVRRKDGEYKCSCPALQSIDCKHKKWVRDLYEDFFLAQDIEKSELEKTFWDMKERGHFQSYKTYEDYKRGKYKD